MAIRRAQPSRDSADAPVRTTLALPAGLLAAIDAEVQAGTTRSRVDFVRYAIEYELWRREQRRIDDEIRAVASDPDYIAEMEQIMKEFESADSETARMIDEEYGPWDGPTE